MELALPPEGTYSDLELDFIENEPPGLFPGDQNSYWGQTRKVFADYLQVLADQLSTWYTNLDPRATDATDINNWEKMLGIPLQTGSGRTLQARRAFVSARQQRGPFTRTRRRTLVESFILATMGASLSLTAAGLSLDASGLSLLAESFSLTGTYNIVENIPNFSYDVRILNTILLDQAGLNRELTRLTPAGITYTLTITATP